MNKRYDDTVQIHLKEPIKDNVQKVKPLNTLSKVDKLINALKLSDKFDPFTMECIEVVAGDEEIVIEDVSPGYMYNDKVLRVAQVKVGGGNNK